jgi:flagellar capping protein FliD
MDTAAMVQQLMRAESMRMDRLTRRRQVLQWRQQDMRGTMGRLNEFRRENTDAIFNRNAINNNSTWNTVNTTVSAANGNGSTTGISVSPTHTARPGSFDVRVAQHATGDIAMGRTFRITDAGTLVPREGTGTAPITTQPGGQALDLNTHTISRFLGHNILPEESTYVRIGDANIRVNGSDSIQQFMNNVNQSELAGANIRFDQMRGTFILEARGTGENALVRTGNDSWGLLANMGLENIRGGAQAGTVTQV